MPNASLIISLAMLVIAGGGAWGVYRATIGKRFVSDAGSVANTSRLDGLEPRMRDAENSIRDFRNIEGRVSSLETKVDARFGSMEGKFDTLNDSVKELTWESKRARRDKD